MSADGGHPVSRDVFPSRSPKILWREVDGSVVLFHEDTGRAFALNETAAVVWKLCDGTRSLEELASRLAESCESDDVLSPEAIPKLIESLARDGCIEVAARPVQRVEAERVAAQERGPQGWSAPVVEEIVFAACDCSGGGRGVMRNAECVTVPRQDVST